MQKRILLFDLDGTLVRTHGAGVRAMSRGFEKALGIGDALGAFSLAGMTDPAIARQVADARLGRGLLPEEEAFFYRCYLDCLGEELAGDNGYTILPGIVEFLEQASREPRLLLGLGTGNLETGARLKLEKGGLNRFFAFGGYGSDAEDRGQVLAAGVRRGRILAGSEVPASEVVVIGDTPKDIAAARAIGAKVVAVATGPFTVEQLAAHAPEAALADFRQASVEMMLAL